MPRYDNPCLVGSHLFERVHPLYLSDHLSRATSQAHLRNLVTEEHAEAAMQILNFAIFSDNMMAVDLKHDGREDDGGKRHRENYTAPGRQEGESLAGVLVVQERKALVMSALDRLFVNSLDEEVCKARHAQDFPETKPSTQA